MNIHLAADHAGFTTKEAVKSWLVQQGHTVVDHGAEALVPSDDYPDSIVPAAQAISQNPTDKAIIFGGSGQGEAIVANRYPGVRAVVYYGEPHAQQTDSDGMSMGIISSAREHNDANVLSVGARFVSEEQAQAAITTFLETNFAGKERHVRRLEKIETATA